MVISTHHRKENGQQETYRIVTITDAAGDEFDHVFRRVDDPAAEDGAHEYLGAGSSLDDYEARDEAPDSAWELLDEVTDEGAL